MITTDRTNKLGTTVAKDLRVVSPRWMEADAETLWAEIRELARNHDYQFAARILEVGEHEHWTVMHVALALGLVGLEKQRPNNEEEVPVVLLHGTSGQSEDWSQVVEQLTKHRPATRLDYP